MLTRSKAALILALIVLGVGIAHAEGIGPSSFGRSLFGGIGTFGGGKVAAQPSGDILLVDGVSLLLQTDGASLICRAGGC